MKRGIVMVLLTSLAFLVTVVYLLSDTTPLQQKPVGVDALQVLEDTRTAQKVTSYVRQSLRNSAYAGLADLSQEGFFPKTVGNTSCPVIQGKPLLYTDASCSYTRKTFEAYYFSFVQRRFATFFPSPLYTLNLTAADFNFTITFDKDFMVLAGNASHSFIYTGKKVTYEFPISYNERIAYDFHHYTLLFKTLQNNLDCMQRFAKQQTALAEDTFGDALLKSCSFSDAFRWRFEKQGDLVFITATTKDPVLFLDNLSFAFAITLNNLHLPSPDNTLF